MHCAGISPHSSLRFSNCLQMLMPSYMRCDALGGMASLGAPHGRADHARGGHRPSGGIHVSPAEPSGRQSWFHSTHRLPHSICLKVRYCGKACYLAQIAVARWTFPSGRGGGHFDAMLTAASPALPSTVSTRLAVAREGPTPHTCLIHVQKCWKRLCRAHTLCPRQAQTMQGGAAAAALAGHVPTRWSTLRSSRRLPDKSYNNTYEAF